MFLIKLLIVPFFIAVVSFAGKRWGTKVAGVLSGMPVVAGPIVVLMAIDQGIAFGRYAALAATSGVASLLAFGVAYCWLSQKFSWYICFVGGTAAWVVMASLLTFIPQNLYIAVMVALFALVVTPFILPSLGMVQRPANSFNDLPLRMLAGGLFTVMVTALAHVMTSQWSGLLAVFPIIGSVMAVFTHITQGSEAVAMLYHGTVKGLYSLCAFFLVLATGWGFSGFWLVVGLGIAVAIIVQLGLFYGSKKIRSRIKSTHTSS